MTNDQQMQELPGGQLSLLTETQADHALEQSEHAQGIYSGVQLRQRDPDRYMAICSLLAEGSLSQRKISKLTGCSRNLISAINKQASDIEPLKEKLAGSARNVAELCMERMEELLLDPTSKISAKDLLIGSGIGTEKFLLLSGEATHRIEAIDSSSGADQFEDQFRLLQQADVVEMGSAGEISAAKGGESGGESGGFGGGSGDCAADDGCLDDDDNGGQYER